MLDTDAILKRLQPKIDDLKHDLEFGFVKLLERTGYIEHDAPIIMSRHAKKRYRDRTKRDLWKDHLALIAGDYDAKYKDGNERAYVFKDATHDGFAVIFVGARDGHGRDSTTITSCFIKSADWPEREGYERVA